MKFTERHLAPNIYSALFRKLAGQLKYGNTLRQKKKRKAKPQKAVAPMPPVAAINGTRFRFTTATISSRVRSNSPKAFFNFGSRSVILFSDPVFVERVTRLIYHFQQSRYVSFYIAVIRKNRAGSGLSVRPLVLSIEILIAA